MVLVFTLLLRLAYPLAVTGVAQVAFAGKADGRSSRSTARSSAPQLHRPGVHERARVLPAPAVGRAATGYDARR